MLTFLAWRWGERFSDLHVRRLAAGIARHHAAPHRFVCVTDRPVDGIECWPIERQDRYLLAIPGCLARLRAFDPAWQSRHGIERLVCIDLDTVITGPLDPLFDRPEPFVILQGANLANPCPFNGALWLLDFYKYSRVWLDFNLFAARKVPHYEFPDDQSWIYHMVPDAAGWTCGPASGAYVYKKRAWPPGDALPHGARLVTFVRRDPKDLMHLPWVREHWCD